MKHAGVKNLFASKRIEFLAPLARCAEKKQNERVREFLQRVENEICERHLFADGQKILIAVSGGLDSMVLLHVLTALAKKNRWKISVAHFNHQLRGRASDADEKLVRAAAKKSRLPFATERGEVARVARQSKISVEMAARTLRHEFLARLAQAEKISNVALAHHADDQVELFFLRLLRGAGGEGLAGMKWHSPSPVWEKITLVRPFLNFPKTEILAFARANNILFRDDATNRSNDFLRNRIRNELLPLLRKNYQPALNKMVLRLMDITGAEAEFAAASAHARLARTDAASEFKHLPVAVQRKMLQQQLTARGVVSNFELVEQLRKSAEKWVSIGNVDFVARAATGKIEMRKCANDFEKKFQTQELRVKLSGRAGRMEFGGAKFHWQIRLQKKIKLPARQILRERAVAREMFDADKIGDEIILRHWRAGDRFQPIGMKSPVKLQDLFVNAKIPAARRRHLILATTTRGEIFWVQTLRLADKFKITPATRRKLFWRGTFA